MSSFYFKWVGTIKLSQLWTLDSSSYKKLEQQDSSVVGIPRRTGALVNLCVADTLEVVAYFITQFGFIFDTLHLTDERKEEIRIAGKKADPFHWFEISVSQYLPLLQDAKEFLRENGNNFKKASSVQHSVLTLPAVKKASSTLEKLLAIEEFERECKGILIHFNWWIHKPIHHSIKNRLGDGKPGSLIVHGTPDSGYLEFINRELLSRVREARLDNTTGKICFFDWGFKGIDSFFINKDKIALLAEEKMDVFALYKAWLEWNLQQINTSIVEWQYVANFELLKSKNSYLYADFRSKRQSKATLTLLREQRNTLLNKIDGLTGPDSDLFSTIIAHPQYASYQNNTRQWNSGSENWTETMLYTKGHKRFELTDHRGNVMATVSDRKTGIDINNDGVVDVYEADIITATDYYPFGSIMPERNNSKEQSYRYGYNGKENDNEIKGEGTQQDYGMRIYDPRVGRFLSVDPITSKYPELTPYQFASNRPIDGVDLDGLEHKGMIQYGQYLEARKTQLPKFSFINYNAPKHNYGSQTRETIVAAGPKNFGTRWKESNNIFAKISYGITNGFYTTGQQLFSSITGQEQIRNIGGTYYDAKGPFGENERVGNFVTASTTFLPGTQFENVANKGFNTILGSKFVNRIFTSIEEKATEQIVKTATQLSVENKLATYLLNPLHPQGGPKAKWFEQALGFTHNNADDLAKQIIFDTEKAVQTAVTQYGTKYNQVISIKGANGKTIDVTFGWIKNKDGVVNLVTGIPSSKK